MHEESCSVIKHEQAVTRTLYVLGKNQLTLVKDLKLKNINIRNARYKTSQSSAW